MLQTTRGIVLRSVKYGDSSLICTVFTEVYGVQAYMVQGVRSTKAARNRAGLLQPASLTDIVVYHQPQKNLQRLREFSPAYLYTTVHEEVVKNSIALFSVEVLLRLLPEEAPMPELFEFAYDYFVRLDTTPGAQAANFPLYFIIQCSRYLGYEVKGGYSSDTPHLNMHEGGYTAHPPPAAPYVPDEDAVAISNIMQAAGYAEMEQVPMNAAMRMRLTEWHIVFLQRYTQHMAAIRSLDVLRAVLH